MFKNKKNVDAGSSLARNNRKMNEKDHVYLNLTE